MRKVMLQECQNGRMFWNNSGYPCQARISRKYPESIPSKRFTNYITQLTPLPKQEKKIQKIERYGEGGILIQRADHELYNQTFEWRGFIVMICQYDPH